MSALTEAAVPDEPMTPQPQETVRSRWLAAIDRPWPWLASFVLLRLCYAWFVPERFGDVTHYLVDIDLIRQGRWHDIDPYFFQGYFLLVIPFCWLGLSSYWAALLSSLLFALLTAAVVASIAERFAGRAAGRWALLIFALQPIAVAYAASSTMETFYSAFFLLGVLLLLQANDSGSLWKGGLAGGAFAVAVLQRNEALLLVAGFVGLIGLLFIFERRSTVSPRTRSRWRAMGPLLAACLGTVLVLGAWVVVCSPRIEGKVLFAKAGRNISIDPVEDKEAWARTLVNQQLGKPAEEKRLGARLVANTRYLAPALGKIFVSPLLLLLPVWGVLLCLRRRAPMASSRRYEYLSLAATALASCLMYLFAALEARYLFLGAMLSIPLAAAGCAWLLARTRSGAVTVLLILLLPGTLLAGFAVRTFRDEPKGKSIIGLEQAYAAHLPIGALVYSGFGRVPETVVQISRERKYEYRTLPFVEKHQWASLLPPDRTEAWVFIDADYIHTYFPRAAFLLTPTRLVESGVEFVPVARLLASVRNPGCLWRISRVPRN